MAAFSFPNSPSDGDVHTTNGKTFVYSGAPNNVWRHQSLSSPITIATSPPSGPTHGDLWWDSDDGDLHIYYDDGQGSPSAQWVTISRAGGMGATGPAGTDGTSGKLLGFATGNTTTNVSGSEDTWVDTGLTVNYTPQSNSSTIIVDCHIVMFGSPKQDSAGSHSGNYKLRLRVQPSGGSETTVGEEMQGSFGQTTNSSYGHYYAKEEGTYTFHEEYSNTSTTQKTFHLECMEQDNSRIDICRESGRSFIVVLEVKM